MTDVGLDYSVARPSVTLLTAHSIKFVCRYLAWPSAKVITKSEYDSYKSAGIEVFLNWEWDARDGLGGANGAQIHSNEAIRQAKALNYPLGSTIYFSTGDFDVFGEGKQVVCLQYTRTASQIVRSAGYRFGTYGSEEYLDLLWSTGILDDGWQSPSTFGRRPYLRDPKNHIYQTHLDQSFYGNIVDMNLRVSTTYSSLGVNIKPTTPSKSGPYIAPREYTYPYEVILDILKFLPAEYRVTDTTRDLNGPIANGHWDYHVGNAAVDFAGTDSEMRDNAAFLYGYWNELTELIHTTPFNTDSGFYVKNNERKPQGFYGVALEQQHLSHVHLAISTLDGAKKLLNRLKSDFPYVSTLPEVIVNEKDLVLQDGPGGPVFVGDGKSARWFETPEDLKNYLHWRDILRVPNVTPDGRKFPILFTKGTVKGVLGPLVGPVPPAPYKY